MKFLFNRPALACGSFADPHSRFHTLKPLSSIDVNPHVNADNITGFALIFALYVGGLILSTIIASKIVLIGPFVLPASVFIWALTYPCSDIVAEVYGRKYAHKMVLGGFLAYASLFVVVGSAIAMPAAPFWEKQEAFESVLGTSLRVMVAAMASYVITQFFDVHIFGWLKQKTKGKHLWLRNNLSTFVSQTMANTIFLSLAFLGVVPVENWVHLFVANLLARYALLISDTGLVYGAVYWLYRAYPELKTD